LLLKRQTFERFGPIKEDTTTKYWLRIALAGYVNGYYYPLVPQEHMDDPRSPHCLIRDDNRLQQLAEVTVVLQRHNIRTMKDRLKRRREVLRNLNQGPWDAKYYVGWRGKLRRAYGRFWKLL